MFFRLSGRTVKLALGGFLRPGVGQPQVLLQVDGEAESSWTDLALVGVPIPGTFMM